MKDIENRADLELVLNAFYRKAFEDDMLRFFFVDIAGLDLESHLPTITDFWESILFGTIRYQGNVMIKHFALDEQRQIGREQIDRWLALFSETINAQFAGPKTEEMLNRARIIGETLFYKLESRRNP